MQRAMATDNCAEYFAYVGVLVAHAKKPALRELFGRNLTLGGPERVKSADLGALGEAEERARRLLGKEERARYQGSLIPQAVHDLGDKGSHF